jgi:hypothetical protein
MPLKHPLRLLAAVLLAVRCAGSEAPPAPAGDANDLVPVEPPALGQTLRSFYGRRVQRLTDHAKEGVAYIQAEYATQNHVNADGTLVKVEFPDGTVHILRRATGEWLKSTLLTSQAPAWDPTDKDRLLYAEADGKHVRLRVLDVRTGQSETELETSAYESLVSGGESDVSPDGRQRVYLGTSAKGAAHVVVYHRDPPRLSAHVLDVTGQHVNWVQISNTRVLVGYDMDPSSCADDIAEHERYYEKLEGGARKLVGCQPVRVYDIELQPAWPNGRTLLAPYWGHGDVGLDATDGNREVWVMANASAPVPRAEWFPGAKPPGPADCENSVVRFTLDSPREPTCLKTGRPGFPWDLALHVAVPAQPSEWAYLTAYRTMGDTQYKPLARSTAKGECTGCTVPFQNEIVRVRLDGKAVERLTHHYSSRYLPGTSTYNWQPRASVDGRGRFVLFNSNFGTGRSNLLSDVYLLDLEDSGVALSH